MRQAGAHAILTMHRDGKIVKGVASPPLASACQLVSVERRLSAHVC